MFNGLLKSVPMSNLQWKSVPMSDGLKKSF